MTAGTAEVVITTKLFRPSLRQQTVERKRLHDVLRQGRTLPLTLVVAPAGWGKSTLVADWLAHDEIPAGWVSLDGGDNDPKRFWRYMLLAADQAGSAAGAAALRRLDAAGSDMLRDVLPAFVNELASAQAPLVVVLDDYHLVTNAQVHTSIATLLEHSPPQLHLMLITRADPLLPIAGMIAFYNEKVDIFLDGQQLERPQTHFFPSDDNRTAHSPPEAARRAEHS